jgi:hypothetical protein
VTGATDRCTGIVGSVACVLDATIDSLDTGLNGIVKGVGTLLGG